MFQNVLKRNTNKKQVIWMLPQQIKTKLPKKKKKKKDLINNNRV